jgi:hypothetical protein
MKEFILQQQASGETPTLLARLVKTFHLPAESGFQTQLVYLLRAMLVCQDPSSPEIIADTLSKCLFCINIHIVFFLQFTAH